MAARHGQNTANGIISIIVLVFGVIISSVTSALLRKFIRNDEGDVSNIVDTTSHRRVSPYATSPIWMLGLFYVVPGLIGFISAFVKQKGVYMAHMVFSIISLVVMGLSSLVGLLAFLRLATTDISECVSMGSKCQCSNSGPVSMTCDDMRSIYTMTIVLALVFVVAWVLSLIGAILSGMLGCRREPVGIIIQRSPVTTTVVHGLKPGMIRTAPMGYTPLQVEYQPQTNDNANLVTNMF